MQRANDNSNQSVDEMRRTVQLLAQRVNQLERMLDSQDIREAKVEQSNLYVRETRLSLNNGMQHGTWTPTDILSSSNAAFDPVLNSNKVYVAGVESTVPAQTTNYLYVPFNGSDCSWTETLVCDENGEGFDVTKTYGDIHLAGNYAG